MIAVKKYPAMLSRKVEKKKCLSKRGCHGNIKWGSKTVCVKVAIEGTAIQHHRVNLLKDIDLLAHPLEGYDVVKPLFSQ